MSETDQSYEPVNQLYTVKTRSDGAASKWQVDTGLIRQFLDEKLKGLVRREIEYFEYEVIKKESNETVARLLALNDKEALSKLGLFCEARDESLMDYRLQATGEVDYKEIIKREKQPLLPDEVVDTLLTPIETTFSQVGYLTKYSENDVKNEVWRNIRDIRKSLATKCIYREDIKQDNLELVINLIKNMIYQVLKASQDGWTGNRISDITQEKLVTHTGDKKRLSFGG